VPKPHRVPVGAADSCDTVRQFHSKSVVSGLTDNERSVCHIARAESGLSVSSSL
jgi:hypothetical protein